MLERFAEKLHVIQAPKDAVLMIEYDRGAITEEQCAAVVAWLEKQGYKRVIMVAIQPGRGRLTLSAIYDRSKPGKKRR
jgi:hypothetical protein